MVSLNIHSIPNQQILLLICPFYRSRLGLRGMVNVNARRSPELESGSRVWNLKLNGTNLVEAAKLLKGIFQWLRKCQKRYKGRSGGWGDSEEKKLK